MSNRTLTIGALGVAAALALPGVASASPSLAIAPGCEAGVTISGQGFGTGNHERPFTVYVNDAQWATGVASWTGRTFSHHVPFALEGSGTVRVVMGGSAGSAAFSCPVATGPAAPTGPVAPWPPKVKAPPKVTRPASCRTILVAIRRGAGPKWRALAIRRGCVERKPLTCASFRRTHPNAGPRAYARVGLRYYACVVPKGRPGLPAVTG